MSDSPEVSTVLSKVATGVHIDSDFEDVVKKLERQNIDVIYDDKEHRYALSSLTRDLKFLKENMQRNSKKKRKVQRKLTNRYLQMGYTLIFYRQSNFVDPAIQFWVWKRDKSNRVIEACIDLCLGEYRGLYPSLIMLPPDSPEVPISLVRHNIIKKGEAFVFDGKLVSVEDTGDGDEELHLRHIRNSKLLT